MINVLYFAWVREAVGLPSEQVVTQASTVQELVEELRLIDSAHDYAFRDISSLRVALDQELSEMTASLAGVREVAFFPPMTGG